MRAAADTTIAYVLDDVIAAAFSLDTGDGNTTPAMRVKEVAVTKTEQEGVFTGHMRVVIGVSTSSFIGNMAQISEIIGKVKIIKIPEYVFIVCSADFTVGTTDVQTGKIIFQNQTAHIGGYEENPLDNVLFGIIDKAMGQSYGTPAESGPAFGSFLFEKVASVVNHVGEIGTARTVGDNFVVAGDVKAGIEGVSDGKLFFITNKN